MAAFDNTNLQSLQAQLARLQSQAQTNGRSGYGLDRGLQDRIHALQNQINVASTSNASKSATAPVDEVGDAKKKILDYTAGRGDAVMNDAMTNQALSRLNSVSAGTDAPYTQAVQNQMLSQQAGMHASAAEDQGEQLRMQAAAVGGSIADPSYQARLRQVNSQRQSANANAQGQIASTAQLQNFGARQQATNGMLSGRMGQMGMANSQYNQAAGYLNQTSVDAGRQAAVQMPSTMYNFSGAQQPMQMPQSPAIQYQQAKPAPQEKTSMAGVEQTAGQYTNDLMKKLMPSFMAGHGTPVQAPYSNSPLKSTRPQGPAQPYTF